MDRTEARQLAASARHAHEHGQAVALATVVKVYGSAYRREGASMLVRDDGAQTCMLSGGCLEGEVVEVALQVLRSGEARLERYDLSEDVVWGLGIGCGGSVDIRIEPLTGDPLLEAWLEVLDKGHSAVLVTPLSGAEGRLLVFPSGPVAGALWQGERVNAALMHLAAQHARELLQHAEAPSGARAWELPTFSPWGEGSHEPNLAEPQGGAAELFFSVSTPAPELVMFGAGHDAVPLARLAGTLGYEVRVVDPRAAFLTPGRFPGARLDLLEPEACAAHLALGRQAHVVIMNHHLDRDRASLRFALSSNAPYVGVLGPRSRFERLLVALAQDGFVPSPEQLARVRSPVGLRLGAETPEEVALSILGELMAWRRAQSGGFLSGHAGRIHAPPEPALGSALSTSS